MSLGSSWGVEGTDEITLRSVRPTLIARARKRTVKDTSKKNAWLVMGDPSLGDEYDHYEVFDSNGWLCSCQVHQHGGSRRVCSHIVAVLLHTDGDSGSGTSPSTPAVWERIDVPVETPREQGKFDPLSAPAPKEKKDPKAREWDLLVGNRIERKTVVSMPGETWHDFEVDDPPSMQHAMFGDPPFPEDFTEFREDQWRAIREILEALEDGYRVVMLSAPTGSGKTIVGEAVRRLWAGREPATFMCSTKTLQDQIERDFPYAVVLKGKDNYPTLDDPNRNCGDCSVQKVVGPACVRCLPNSGQGESYFSQMHEGREYQHCFYCHPVKMCPYRQTKEAAIHASLSVLNYAYWMAENRGPGRFSGRPFVIADEADMLEEELMRNIEIQLTPGERKKLGIYTLPKKTVPSDWVRWIREDVIPAYNRELAMLSAQMNQQSMMDPDPKVSRRFKRAKMRRDRFTELTSASPYVVAEEGQPTPTLLEDGWVMTGYESRDYRDAYLTWKPIKVNTMANDYLFAHAEQWLLMSATLVSPEQMAEDLGLGDDEWVVVEMDSTFPVGRRPIYADRANVSMTHKTKDTAWPQMVKMVDECVDEHPGKRVLIHTVSYALTQEIINKTRHRGSRMMTYYNASERGEALERFLGRKDAVLLAPSFERGVDLPGEDCEVIIVAKMPFPYIGDKQVSKRMYGKGGQQWYAVATIRSICQMTGRGMRSKNDWCETYIFDGQFRKLYREWKRLFPRWWRDAVVLDRNDPKTRRMLEEV